MVAPLTGFPTFDIPAILTPLQANRADIAFPRSWSYNFETGEIVTDGVGKAIEVDGFRALVIWCVNAALTRRYHHIIYGPQFGTELIEAFDITNEGLQQSEIRKTLTEALQIDVRVKSVENFVFLRDGDIMHIDFDVFSTNNDQEHITLGFPTP